VDAAAQDARVKLQIGQRADSLQLMKELVQAGLGYTVLPYYAVAREVSDGLLTFTAIQDPPVVRHLFLAMPSNSDSPRAVLQVEACVRQEIAGQVIAGSWPGAQILTLEDM
jgi:LysR family nitrogen assimilation transcriptional regulator